MLVLKVTAESLVKHSDMKISELKERIESVELEKKKLNDNFLNDLLEISYEEIKVENLKLKSVIQLLENDIRYNQGYKHACELLLKDINRKLDQEQADFEEILETVPVNI